MRCSCEWLGLARTIYIRCTHGIFGSKTTKLHGHIRSYTVYDHIDDSCQSYHCMWFTLSAHSQDDPYA